MAGCVQVISREIVKPSSQIHNHPKKFKLSYLDQLMPPMYIPIIFFYQADESKGLTTSNHDQISQHLKHSLSRALTSFYPLAGRFESEENIVVECNDDVGIEFIEARVHVHLMDAIKNPNMEELNQYIPIDPTSTRPSDQKPFVIVQITFFDCGGIALCVCFSHLIADLKSIYTFINAWAGKCQDQNDTQLSQSVSFNLAEYFPTKKIAGPNVWGLAMSNEKFTTKRFVFDKETIEHLKQDAISSSRVKNPSRVEVVSAFIWRHCIEVAKSKKKSFFATHAVNLRAKKLPTHLLENVFGNCVMNSVATTCDGEDIVSQLRSAIRKIDDEYITKAQSGDNHLNDLYKMFSELLKGEGDCRVFSSWCRFPLYEVDYGFGKPYWLCTTALPLKNFTLLVDSKCGNNIEAWVNMEQDYLQMLQHQIDLIPHSSTH